MDRESLEKKAKEIATKWKAYGVPYNAIYDAVIEMADWQKEKEQQRLHSDENIQALAGRYAYEEWDEDDCEVARDSFIDGYNICKQQMMKDAVESEVEITSKGILLTNLKIEDFDYADKARVIIIKDE